MDGRKIDAAGDFAERLGVSPVCFDASRTDSERLDQGGRDHTDLVSQVLGGIGDSKRLGAGLQDHAAVRPSLEICGERPGPAPAFLQDGSVGASYADLGLAAPEIDGNVILTDGLAQSGELVSARVTDASDYDLVASLELGSIPL